MTKRNKYSEYGRETQQFMLAVEKHLIDKFGNINSEWEGVLSMLATQYQVFVDCKDRIREDGMMITDRFNSLIKHPLLKVETDAIIQCNKLVQEFGLSPKSLKGLSIQNNNEDEFLNELVK